MSAYDFINFFFEDRPKFDTLRIARLEPGDLERLRDDLVVALEPLARARERGGRIQWRVDELRGEPSTPLDMARDTQPGELCALGIASAVKHGGNYPPDLFPTAFLAGEELASRLGDYQNALFRAAVVAELLTEEGFDLTRTVEGTTAAITADEPILERITDAAYRLPYWTTNETLLNLAPSIERACELLTSVRNLAVREAVERIVADVQSLAKPRS